MSQPSTSRSNTIACQPTRLAPLAYEWLANAGDVILFLDSERGEIAWANHRAKDMFGPLRGIPLETILIPEEANNVWQLLDRLHTTSSLRTTLTFHTHQGTPWRADTVISRTPNGLLLIARTPTPATTHPPSPPGERQAALSGIGAGLTLTLDPTEMLWITYAQLRQVWPFDAFYVAFYDNAKHTLDYRFVVIDGQLQTPFRQECQTQENLDTWIVQNRRPFLIHDWENDQIEITVSPSPALQTPMRSWLGIPLTAKQRIIGLLALGDKQPNTFSDEDLHFLFPIADQLAIALENARLYQETQTHLREVQQANREIQALQEAITVVQSTLDLDQVLTRIVEVLVRELKYRVALVAEANHRPNTLTIRAMAIDPQHPLPEPDNEKIQALLGLSLPMDNEQNLAVHATLHQQTETSLHLASLLHPIISAEQANHLQDQLEAQIWVTLPLAARGDLVGNLIVGSTQTSLTDREIASLRAFANQAAVAIAHARLYETQLRRARQLETVRELSERIVSILNEQELIRLAENLIRLRFGYDRVQIHRTDQNSTPSTLTPVAAWVAEHQRSLLVSDLSTTEWDTEQGSEIGVPLFISGQVVGVLDVWNRTPYTLGEEDVFALEALAGQIAIAMENARLYQETDRRLAEVSILYTVSQQITSTLDLEIVLDTLVTVLRRVLDCRGCCIFLLDEESQTLEIKAASGIKPRWRREAKMHLGEGISGKVALEGRPLYIPDTTQDPDFIVFDPEVRSLMVVPLISKDRIIGTLNVDDDTVDAFSPDEGRLLTIVAAQAAVVIENAQLHARLKERAARLEKAYEELKELNRLKSEFVQNVSHELRTPLTFIKGYVELLLEGTLGELSPRQRESLEIVLQRTNAVIRLVEDILLLQRLERGGLQMAPFDLAELARQIAKGAAVTASQAGLTLTAEIEDTLPTIWGDRDRIQQVFDNLIGNAIKFTPEGGQITIRVRRDSEDTVRVEVQDTGIGIPAHEHERIFERFYQVDGSTKRRYGGAGLGLAIVKEIIDAHGGTVWVDSIEGQGSTFIFRLPIMPPTLHQSGAEPKPHPKGDA